MAITTNLLLLEIFWKMVCHFKASLVMLKLWNDDVLTFYNL